MSISKIFQYCILRLLAFKNTIMQNTSLLCLIDIESIFTHSSALRNIVVVVVHRFFGKNVTLKINTDASASEHSVFIEITQTLFNILYCYGCACSTNHVIREYW